MADSVQDAIMVKAGLEWLAEHTTIPIDLEDSEAFTGLPSRAQLFVRKYGEIMQRSPGVTSQSIEGLSMSFDASENMDKSIWALARALLGADLKSQVRVIPARRRW